MQCARSSTPCRFTRSPLHAALLAAVMAAMAVGVAPQAFAQTNGQPAAEQSPQDGNTDNDSADTWIPDWENTGSKKPERKPAKPDDADQPVWDEPVDSETSHDDASVTDALVTESLARAVGYLKGVQGDEGEFAGQYYRSYPLGETALALLALRYAGVGVTDPAYKKGEQLLLNNKSQMTYSNSLIAQVLAMVPQEHRTPAIRQRMNELGTFLTRTQLANGMWTYSAAQKSFGDNSNTQFAILALWQLAEAGAEFNLRSLRGCESHFLETQLPGGGWAYMLPRSYIVGNREVRQKPAPRPSMTATGLASLYIVEDLLHLRDKSRFIRGKAVGCGKLNPLDNRIDKALAAAEKDLAGWFTLREKREQELKKQHAAGAAWQTALTMYDLYYLYSVERVAAASGKKHLGQIDWYAKGVELILRHQQDDGSWGIAARALRRGSNASQLPQITETSLAMLFLAKGRSPIFFNKLRYDGSWNTYRRDTANATRYASRQLEQRFNWQVIDIRSDVAEWFDSPVLLFNGYTEPKFGDQEKARLKEYVDRGGFLFAEACCGKAEFTDAVGKVGDELWPQLKWRELPADHPIFTRKSHIDLESPPKLLGLTDAKGFTFFVLSPTDISCIWHQRLVTTHREAFLLALNLYRYAARGKPIRSRLGR